MEEIKADHNRHLAVEGIVVNQFQARAGLPQKVVQELIDEGLPVVQPYLSSSVKIKESHEQAKPMIHLDARHKLSLEFVALHDSLAKNAGPDFFHEAPLRQGLGRTKVLVQYAPRPHTARRDSPSLGLACAVPLSAVLQSVISSHRISLTAGLARTHFFARKLIHGKRYCQMV